MSRIRANIDELERAASAFSGAAQHLAQIIGEQQQRITAVEWAGRAQEKFLTSWVESGDTVKRLSALTSQMASQCANLAEALRRADEEARRREQEAREKK